MGAAERSAAALPGDEAARRLRDLYWQGHADRPGEPTALIGAFGALMRATPEFERVVRAGDGLTLASRGGVLRLTAIAVAEQPRLDAAIARAAASATATAAAVRCSRPNGRPALIVAIRPIPWTSRSLRPHEAAATVTLIDPARRPPQSHALWREAFGLTPSETELTALLMAGHSLESAAATRGCRLATLRVHLRRVFAKTGVSRQADLVALLARIG